MYLRFKLALASLQGKQSENAVTSALFTIDPSASLSCSFRDCPLVVGSREASGASHTLWRSSSTIPESKPFSR